MAPHSDEDQHHDVPVGGSQAKICTTPLNKSAATVSARTQHSAYPDMMGSPIDWVQAYLAEKDKPPSWLPELWSLGPGQFSNGQVKELAKKQAAGFRLLAAQDDKMD